MSASGATKKDMLRKLAQEAFVQEEPSRPVDPRVVGEEARQAASTAKSSGLRELRLARDAAARKAVEAAPPPWPGTKTG
ncbi:hypothetical protein SAMN05444161_3925 [Rhizobiales bacterium GAS191]|jgi:hypothetical protein|nr:hypothetical protein SAMN05519103_03041 [Rhizobiales bacterium GAS113]SED75586.1 hypothetical protein SAMN05444161_3925 [Rhizobiales bacterium GAS191]SEE70135.1 hypothetical protein SAMN05519104_7120 [Rhizobiales bacterium GAS188]